LNNQCSDTDAGDGYTTSHGILLSSASYSIVLGNTCNSNEVGIRCSSNYCTISENTCNSNQRGILV
jgi:parallel beta-helix repeat protein